MSENGPELEIVILDDGRIKVAVMLGEQELSRAFIIPMTMRYGVATVRMDGIGDVATDAAHRHQGHSRRVMEAAVARMRDGPASVTTLYGIGDFYPKYGYATLGPESAIGFSDLDELGEMPVGWQLRPARVSDLPSILAIYDGCTAEAIGALVREPGGVAWARLRDSLERADGECRVVVDPAGSVEGYAWRASGCWWMAHWERWTPGGLKLAEALARSPLAADALLAGCAEWARTLQQGSVGLTSQQDGHVGLAAMLRSSEVWHRYTRAGEFMGRVVGVTQLLRALEPELARVWARSGSGFRGVLRFDTGEDEALIALDDGTLTTLAGEDDRAPDLVVELPPGDLARLVFGGMPAAEQLARVPGVEPATIDVLAALFPRRFPYIYPADRF